MSEIVPADLIGVWSRQSISVNGGAYTESSQVIWLQTPSRYVDVRVPIDHSKGEKEAFGGIQKWDIPKLTFHHELDYSNHYPIDEGTFSWDGNTLIETGSVIVGGECIDYEERWARLCKPDPHYLAIELRDRNTLQAIALRVEDHAVVITSANGISANYYKFVEGKSIRQRSVGVENTLQPPTTDLSHKNDGHYSGWKLVEQRL